MRVKEIKVTKSLSVDELIKFIETASQFESDIKIIGRNFNIDAKSILGVFSVIIGGGIDVTIMTRGDDEEEALKEITKLLI